MKGRPPKDPALHEASGAYDKHPERRKPQLKKLPAEWPEKPEFIAEDPIANDRWEWACLILEELGLLTGAEEVNLAVYARTYSNWIHAMEENVIVEMKVEQRLAKAAEQLGLTQLARIKLNVVKEEKEASSTDRLNEEFHDC